jgi:hypothetical protein
MSFSDILQSLEAMIDCSYDQFLVRLVTKKINEKNLLDRTKPDLLNFINDKNHSNVRSTFGIRQIQCCGF